MFPSTTFTSPSTPGRPGARGPDRLSRGPGVEVKGGLWPPPLNFGSSLLDVWGLKMPVVPVAGRTAGSSVRGALQREAAWGGGGGEEAKPGDLRLPGRGAIGWFCGGGPRGLSGRGRAGALRVGRLPQGMAVRTHGGSGENARTSSPGRLGSPRGMRQRGHDAGVFRREIRALCYQVPAPGPRLPMRLGCPGHELGELPVGRRNARVADSAQFVRGLLN